MDLVTNTNNQFQSFSKSVCCSSDRMENEEFLITLSSYARPVVHIYRFDTLEFWLVSILILLVQKTVKIKRSNELGTAGSPINKIFAIHRLSKKKPLKLSVQDTHAHSWLKVMNLRRYKNINRRHEGANVLRKNRQKLCYS